MGEVYNVTIDKLTSLDLYPFLYQVFSQQDQDEISRE